MPESVKYLLPENKMPKAWYNLAHDLPVPLPPPLHPGTGQVLSADDLAVIFPRSLIEQEMSTEQWIEIPKAVQDVYRLWRPSPLIRARRLEQALGTPAKIFFKYEGVSPSGSHKPNSAVPQAYYNKLDGTKRLVTETGAGQWGCSIAFAGSLFGLAVDVYMVRVSYDQKPYRRALMETYGAHCYASPSPRTKAGRDILAQFPDTNGSLGIAISEAVEVAIENDDTHYTLGSVLNHVCLHQTIIGEEAILQMEMAGESPDVVIACTGGGSNFAGLAFPFIRENIKHGQRHRIVAAEPASCPTLTLGRYAYDYGDTAGLTPLVKMHTLGAQFIPPGSHSGGLRYHGMSPLVSHVKELGLCEAVAHNQTDCFKAAVMFARAEGIVPAPESSHAVKTAIDEALRCKAEGKGQTILFNLSGHGHFDMQAYTDYLAGKLTDTPHDPKALEEALRHLPKVG